MLREKGCGNHAVDRQLGAAGHERGRHDGQFAGAVAGEGAGRDVYKRQCARRLVEKGLLVYVAGGLLKPGTQALVGAAARESIGRYNFTKAFIGTNGISLGHGSVSYTHL